MKKKTNIIGNYVIPVLCLGAAFAVGGLLLRDDFGRFLSWWLVLLTLGVVAYPVTGLIFGRFHDGGFIFSKAIGLAFAGMLMWYLSSLHLMKFDRFHSVLCVGICLVIGVIICILTALRQKKSPDGWYAKSCGYRITHETIGNAIRSEALFLLFFAVWCYLRAFKPEAYGTEKFMDYGFMAIIDRCEYMPPEDLWMSGKSINYYYVGQYLATYMTKLSGVGVAYGYNLMLMTLAAFGFTMPFSIANNLVRTYLADRSLRIRTEDAKHAEKRAKRAGARLSAILPGVGGIVAGLAVSIAGNMHFLFFRYLVPGMQRLAGYAEEDVEKFWFPNSTRYIGYNPETSDKTIHEFPSYSFILGDLHAHVINIMFVLTVLGMLFAWLLYRKEKMDELRLGGSVGRSALLRETLHPMILVLGFFIGMFHTTNFWDFPIYFVVAGAIILFSNAVIYQFSLDTIKLTALQAAVVLVISKLVSMPFTMNFEQISTQIRLNYYRTPLHQLAILWGLPVILIAIYLWDRYTQLQRFGVLSGVRYENGERVRDNKYLRKSLGETKEKVVFLPEKNKLFQFIENLQVADLFLVTIALCAIGLVLIPELVYVKDIYTGDYKRANTMFKLTYQSYIMFGICMAYILTKLIVFARSYFQRAAGILLAVCLLTTFGYFGNATKAWFGDVTDRSRYQGLDATAFLARESAQDAETIAWMNENIEGRPVVLESWGASYSFHERVSAMTGFPTVFGWQTHEWLWRSDATGGFPAVVDERRKDVLEIYFSNDEGRVRELIEKYDIEYIYVGKMERSFTLDDTVSSVYDQIAEERGLEESINEELLLSLGEKVYETEPDGNHRTTYLIKVSQNR